MSLNPEQSPCIEAKAHAVTCKRQPWSSRASSCLHLSAMHRCYAQVHVQQKASNMCARHGSVHHRWQAAHKVANACLNSLIPENPTQTSGLKGLVTMMTSESSLFKNTRSEPSDNKRADSFIQKAITGNALASLVCRFKSSYTSSRTTCALHHLSAPGWVHNKRLTLALSGQVWAKGPT